MSFFEHLEELRWHIIRSIISILVITILVFVLKGFIFDYLIFGPKSPDFITYRFFCGVSNYFGLGNLLCMGGTSFEIINYNMVGQFMVHLKVSIALGFIISFPYLVWELWRFIKPGLYANERKYASGLVFYTSLLFFIGVSFGYLVLAPFSINFFVHYNVSESVENLIALESYIAIITTIVLASGIMFELPIMVYILSKMGLLTPEFMRSHRRHALIIILFVGALVTPADIWTQVLVAFPVYFLYELSIFISARVSKDVEIT
ncbi:UNVERIFIED_CONTAM: hypothetical protein GTU68_044664 [Idotea baltica]|nr:hypothetical protein [Idotea baltica]